MTYDETSYDAAQHFLEDPVTTSDGISFKLTDEERAMAADRLAKVIQTAIETELHDIADDIERVRSRGKK